MAKVIKLPVVQKARKKAGKPEPLPRQWLCRRCESDIGIATSEIVQIVTAPRTKGLKVEGGTKRWRCAHCWRRGIITDVF